MSEFSSIHVRPNFAVIKTDNYEARRLVREFYGFAVDVPFIHVGGVITRMSERCVNVLVYGRWLFYVSWIMRPVIDEARSQTSGSRQLVSYSKTVRFLNARNGSSKFRENVHVTRGNCLIGSGHERNREFLGYIEHVAIRYVEIMLASATEKGSPSGGTRNSADDHSPTSDAVVPISAQIREFSIVSCTAR